MASQKKRILIIEKDDDMRFMLSAVVNDAGYLVEGHTGGSCIVDGKIEPPDMFIIEKEVPAIDGIAICKYLRVHNESKGIPVVIMSTYEAEKKAIRAGADAFLLKPFELAHLLETIKRSMDRMHDSTGLNKQFAYGDDSFR
jgi:DNA-binding response OmpR family regulator